MGVGGRRAGGAGVDVAPAAHPAADQPPGQPDPHLPLLHLRPPGTDAGRESCGRWWPSTACCSVGPSEVMSSYLGHAPQHQAAAVTATVVATGDRGRRHRRRHPAAQPFRRRARRPQPGRVRGHGGGGVPRGGGGLRLPGGVGHCRAHRRGHRGGDGAAAPGDVGPSPPAGDVPIHGSGGRLSHRRAGIGGALRPGRGDPAARIGVRPAGGPSWCRWWSPRSTAAGPSSSTTAVPAPPPGQAPRCRAVHRSGQPARPTRVCAHRQQVVASRSSVPASRPWAPSDHSVELRTWNPTSPQAPGYLGRVGDLAVTVITVRPGSLDRSRRHPGVSGSG